MDLVGLTVLTLQYLEIIAWSSFAFVYPLCASIQAMESKSRKDMRKLMAYWIIFSLLMLFEIALGNIIRLIIPLWCCIKLLTVCWFGLPHFERADTFYCNQIAPFLSELRTSIIQYLCKPMEEIVLSEECFLALVDKFVDLNGSEALEELFARKSSQLQKKPSIEDLTVEPKEECKRNIIIESVVQPNGNHGDAKPERNIQREENVATLQASPPKKPDVEDLKAELKEANKGSIEPVVYQPDSKAGEIVKPEERNIEREENVATSQPDVDDAEAEHKEESKECVEPVVHQLKPDAKAEENVKLERNLERKENMPIIQHHAEEDGILKPKGSTEIEENVTTQVVANPLDELQPATVEEAAEGNLTETPKVNKKKLCRDMNVFLTCTTCQVTVDEKTMQSHLRGKKHMANLRKEFINFYLE